MGFSLVAAAAIIGVSILISLELMIGTTIPTLTDMYDSYDEMKDRSIDQFQTNINITSVTTWDNGTNFDLNFTVNNTGSITLKANYFNVLVNGTRHTFTCEKPYLYPDKQIWFNVTNLPGGTASHRLKVVTDNGISDYKGFITT